MTVSDKKVYDCKTCPYPRYKDGSVIFCDVCIRKILDEQNEKKERKLGDYEIIQSIYIGDKEVVFGVDKKDPYPFMVCYCDYHNPLSAAWPTEGVASDDYLEAMQIFVDRVQSQIDRTKAELAKFPFDKTVFTKEHCSQTDWRKIEVKIIISFVHKLTTLCL